MPIAGEPLLLRTLRQLHDARFRDVTVVLGFQHEIIQEALTALPFSVRTVLNHNFATDTNIGSLLCGLRDLDSPALVVEGDVALDDRAVGALAHAATGPDSVWFTNGSFAPHRLGGCLQTDEAGRVTDLRYLAANEPRYFDYRKLLGVVYVGPREMPRFLPVLRAAAAQTLAQYYMIPWCENLAALPAVAIDLSHCCTGTFNTPEEYEHCQTLFATPRGDLHVP
jgi:NDP-sugar pyrophosphorylase family protein